MRWKLVVIESPYAGEVERNLAYLHRCIRDCIDRGESPYASHLMLTIALDDGVPEQRAMGIEAGLAFRRAVEGRVFYLDYGFSGGMRAARTLYETEGLPFEERRIGSNCDFDVSDGGGE